MYHIFVLITNLLFSQTDKSIHQVQSKYYSSIATPPVDKVNIKTGLDILLDKKQHLIIDKKLHLLQIKLVLIKMELRIIKD